MIIAKASDDSARLEPKLNKAELIKNVPNIALGCAEVYFFIPAV